MKAKYLTLIGIFLVVFLGSCDLQEEPYGFYSEDNFYQTPGDAEAALLYSYDALTYLEYSRSIFYVGDLPSEEMAAKADEGADVQELDSWNVSSFSTNGMLENFFQYAYIGLNRANAVIERVPESDFSQEEKDRYLGEAYFLRAWNYFNLARNFGKVPIQHSVVETLDQTTSPVAANLDEIYDLIISDCQEAISRLTINRRVGRVDIAAAQALLSKVSLTIASSKEHGVPQYVDMQKDVDEMYSQAAEYARQVVDGQSEYGFDDDLLHIYDIEAPQGVEHIFLMGMDRSGESEGKYSKIGKLFIPYIDGATIYMKDYDGTYTPSHDGFSSFQTTTEFYNSFDGSDKRNSVLLVDSVYNENQELTATYPGSILYPFSRKYVDPNFIGDKESTKPYLIRFSDVALILAEAVGPTPEGYELVNYIRNRAGLGDLQPGLGTDQFRQAVLEERSFELAFEGNRTYDLKRFNIMQETVPAAASLTDEEVAFYPIPQREIDLNPAL